MQEAEARAAEASEQLEQAQARAQATEEQLAQESELRSTAEQRAADEQAARESLEADSAAQDVKVSFAVPSGSCQWLHGDCPRHWHLLGKNCCVMYRRICAVYPGVRAGGRSILSV